MGSAIPLHEQDGLEFTIEEADELASAGRIKAGAELFSGAIYRLEQEAAAGEEWAAALRDQYAEELAKYHQRHRPQPNE